MYDDIQLVILEGRGMNRFLREWCTRFRHRRILNVSDFRDHVACHRNRVFRWFRDECPLPWLLTIDDDVVPVPDTDALLAAQGDIVATRAWANTGELMHPHAFSMACLKVHRRVVETIQPPWFGFTFTQDGVAQVQCECLYFHGKAAQAGFGFVNAGRVGHRFPVTVLPGSDEGDGPEFLFDNQVIRRIKSS